ncbi:hypothetical protein I8748_08805 [Nostoc sp. CENA67]|uniref:Uncharacterized protein n=1 Tax=Amazonocrinis nigriterrae CENA67 TaxID=2794033 RepID=A0A8J7HTR5_9NOST|nr:hypothetical protein [Amazonocrinis nigriterrae]MBH8562274.1 hypothetical protein [Amazonocrinis nigriterrae CENA67]
MGSTKPQVIPLDNSVDLASMRPSAIAHPIISLLANQRSIPPIHSVKQGG